jgi:hypothetical protein
VRPTARAHGDREGLINDLRGPDRPGLEPRWEDAAMPDLTVPEWWRDRHPDAEPVDLVDEPITGELAYGHCPPPAKGPHDVLGRLTFYRAALTGAEVLLDEVGISVLWSSFHNCTFRQHNRPLVDGLASQGSFGNRPSLYRGCRFVGVRWALPGKFSTGEARFEDCVFEHCHWGAHFARDADFVRCTFIGPMKTGAFSGVSPRTGRRNEIIGNDFTATDFRGAIGWRDDFPIDMQRWPAGYVPIPDL